MKFGVGDQEALGSADMLSVGPDGLSDGVSTEPAGLDAGVLAAGAFPLPTGVVVAAGVLQARIPPPSAPASVKASRIRFVIGEPPVSGTAWSAASLAQRGPHVRR